ncbi:MAG TPA: DUF4256 domain-containing protein [Bacteroidia bacterium]|nr:MAG: hypothetical protein UZ10_BCD003000835 [Bacteroidetes bacterium OLB10]MBV6454086.1 hypothetical protein [Bacteroidia bacterium]MBX3105575.1 DUF4256 domain-containing protein [Bacteroidota bacterium]MCE7954868.1 DUF4256 domain-containing protein [Bacteroidetes bacterium CHB6]OQB60973.1 MAG: hypothetical protein BWX95_02023 [Bacteroidetes bacterium ADurb.Bin141]
MKKDKSISDNEKKHLITIIQSRFEKNMQRHKGIKWNDVEQRLLKQADKLWTLNEMEISGGEPDVIDYDKKSDKYIFCDCSPESPKGRRSLCYDEDALQSRKEHKPKDSAMAVAKWMGIEMIDEKQYELLQSIGNFDLKTSSWLKTPDNVRELGGAIFGDYRFGRVFIYHNGAESYYAARGFRGIFQI